MTVFYYWMVCAASFFVKYVTGFGNTLIMTTLYAFVLPTAFITPVDLLLNLPANLSVVWGSRQKIEKQRVLQILIYVLMGTLPGALLLKNGNMAVMKFFLGLLVMALGAQMLLCHPACKKANTKPSPFILMLCGVALGAYGVGAVLAAYLKDKIEDAEEFRGTLCSVFLLENLSRIFTYWSTGLLTWQVLRFDLILLPAVLIGLFIGRITLRRIKPQSLKKGVEILLIFSGASLAANNLFFLL